MDSAIVEQTQNTLAVYWMWFFSVMGWVLIPLFCGAYIKFLYDYEKDKKH
jgi:hypothetical protein